MDSETEMSDKKFNGKILGINACMRKEQGTKQDWAKVVASTKPKSTQLIPLEKSEAGMILLILNWNEKPRLLCTCTDIHRMQASIGRNMTLGM